MVTILRTWDNGISLLRSKLTAEKLRTEHFKNALVSWGHGPRKALGDLMTQVKRPRPVPTEAYRALGIRSHGKGTFQRIVSRPDDIDMDTVFEVSGNDLVVNITFAWEGAIALARSEDEGTLVSHRFPTFSVTREVNRDYLGYAVRSRRFVHALGTVSPGGAGRNRVLNQSDFLKLTIPFPPLDEQNRIAAILTSMDRKVEAIVRLRDLYARQKQGLMQRFLTKGLRATNPVPLVAAQ